MIITLKTLMIKNVCIQIFVVHQRFFKDRSKNHRWSSKKTSVIHRLTQQKQWRSKKFPSNLSSFQQCSSKASSTNNQGSSNEISLFSRLLQTKLLSLMFSLRSSKTYQRFFIGSSTINQSSSKRTSTFWWLSH